MAAASAPRALTHNPAVRIAADLRAEIAARGTFPPGETSFSGGRTHRMATDPLPVLLEAYERYGPVFSVRVLHRLQVFLLGPEANHFVTVSGAENFVWREGGMGELEPLLGDGLLTTDGAYHRRARLAMLPAFHRDHVAGQVQMMVDETEAALSHWAHRSTIDVYAWARQLAMRIAMRALLGLDPDDGDTGATAAREFERALHFYGTEYALRVLRGPGSPWWRMHRARAVLDAIVLGEIERRRRGDGEGDDVLSMLLGAADEQGNPLSDREVRDQAVTLLFAGHDTSTSTISFLLHELARHPHELALLVAEQDEVLGGSPPGAADLTGRMPRLEMVLDEVLRLYPPAWIGPRRSVTDFELHGVHVPGGAFVNYCSWASHRLPEVFSDPESFSPDRFAPERKAALPKGAYVPFGGGSRSCIGMRFGQMEVKAVATLVLQRFGLELLPGRTMSVRQMPTLSPRGGLRMTVRERAR
ncbi:MAG: cytochrome P450 [Thermoleophilaceae bacterium]